MLKHLFGAVPAFFLLSYLLFWLQKYDKTADTEGGQDWPMWWQQQTQYTLDRGLNQPVFYVDICPRFFPDTLDHWPVAAEAAVLRRWVYVSGSWPLTRAYHTALSSACPDSLPMLRNVLMTMRLESDLKAHTPHFTLIKTLNPALAADLIEKQSALLAATPSTSALWWPQIRWHGRHNQYHAWLVRSLWADWPIGDRPKAEVWRRPLSITLILGLFSLILAYIIGFWAAVGLFLSRKKKWQPYLKSLSLALYALPTFVWAALCIWLFTQEQTGLKWTNIGLIDDFLGQKSPVERLWDSRMQLILPLFCLCLHPTIVVMRQVYHGFENDWSAPFVQVARGKGLSDGAILRQHLSKKALYSLVALSVHHFPKVLLGTWVVEAAFNIPGLGSWLLEAVWVQDDAVLSTFLLYTAFFTYIFALLGQRLQRFFHPISPSK